MTDAPKLLGTDGRKMSKSYHNTISLTDAPDVIRKTAQSMFTDPMRIKRADPGHPETCNVCNYWKVFDPSRADKLWEECRTAARGCVQNKQELAEALIEMAEPFRASSLRAGGAVERDDVERILQDGARRARAVARQTLAEVRRVIGLPSAAPGERVAAHA